MMTKQKNQRNMMKRSMKRYEVSFPIYTKSDCTHWVVFWLPTKEASLAFLTLRGCCTALVFLVALQCVVVHLSGCFSLVTTKELRKKICYAGMCPARTNTCNH